MPSTMRVKICGLTSPAQVRAAVQAGADYVGFVFFPRSPRALSIPAARDAALAVPPGVAKVALTVDADDALLDAILAEVPIDILQLHGAESPERVQAVKARSGLAVMKAVGLSEASDLAELERQMSVADQVLVDAKPPRGAARPGGNAIAFDWRLIAGRRWPVPWMLAGGLSPDNVARAVQLTGARQVDVSSGVETAPGQKDPARMARFITAARAAQAAPAPSTLTGMP